MKRSLGMFMLLALIVPASSYAVDTVSLNELIARAKDKNPEINAARNNSVALSKRAVQDRAWPDPVLFIDNQKYDLGTENETMYGITQNIPFPGKLSIKGKIAGSFGKLADLEYKETTLNVITQIKRVYANYYYTSNAIAVYDRLLSLLKAIESSSESKYITGTATQSDVLRAQVEISRVHNIALTLMQEKELIKTELNSLLGNGLEDGIGDPEDIKPEYLKISWKEIKESLLKNSLQIKAADISAYKGLWESRYSKAAFLPDFGLTYRKRQSNAQAAGQDLMIEFTLPVWFWKPLYGVKESNYSLKSAEFNKESIQRTAMFAARTSFIKLQNIQRQLELYETTILPQSEQSVKVSESSYRSDKEDFLKLLDSIRALLDFQLDYYNNIAEYRKNIAELELIVGVEDINVH